MSGALESLADLFPESQHVRDVGLSSAPDDDVWDYAREQSLVIVSKDSDFQGRSFLFGHPPKVVWIRRGNCSTERLETILRTHCVQMQAFNGDNESALLALS